MCCRQFIWAVFGSRVLSFRLSSKHWSSKCFPSRVSSRSADLNLRLQHNRAVLPPVPSEGGSEGRGEYALLQHRKRISHTSFLVCGNDRKMAVAVRVSAGCESRHRSNVVRRTCVKRLISESGSGCFRCWSINSIWRCCCPPLVFLSTLFDPQMQCAAFLKQILNLGLWTAGKSHLALWLLPVLKPIGLHLAMTRPAGQQCAC